MLMLCPICAGEFEKPLAECPECECRLIASSLKEAAFSNRSEPGQQAPFVELCRPRAYPVAMLVKQMLEQNGVSAIVQGGHALSVMPHLAFGGELRVLVEEGQLEYARALYHAYFESDGETDFIPDEY